MELFDGLEESRSYFENAIKMTDKNIKAAAEREAGTVNERKS